MTVPKVRTWALGRLRPMMRQTWPRLAQVLSQPWRLALGLGGNLLLTVAYVGAFDATLRAFGQGCRSSTSRCCSCSETPRARSFPRPAALA